MVARHLIEADPASAVSVTELAHALTHSSGAIGAALERLVNRGEAERVGVRPRRYRATPSTVEAAEAGPRSPRRPRTRGVSPAPGSGGRAGGSSVPPGAVLRPSGQPYFPRELAGMPDVEALRRLREADVPVLLYGPPGTGKTSLLEAAYPDLITVAGDGDTTVGDLVGEYTQREDRSYEFVHGPLVTAMREGRALLIDDATLISPSVLAVLYPAMDGRREIRVKAHKGEMVTAAPGFFPIAGHNPGVHGAVLSEALASRFSVQIRVTSDYDLAAHLGVNPVAVRVARHLAKRQESGEVGWAPQLRELLGFQRVADALGAEVAFANLVGTAPEEDQEQVAVVVATAIGTKTVAPLSLGARLPLPPGTLVAPPPTSKGARTSTTPTPGSPRRS
ncbi:AAA family ATPase [Streptomyces sedi]